MDFLLRKLCILLNIHIYGWQPESKTLRCYGLDPSGNNPFPASQELREMLKKQADATGFPAVLQDEWGVFTACIRAKDGYLLLGPVRPSSLSHVELHQYCKKYGVSNEYEFHLTKLSLQKFLTAAEMIYFELYQKGLTDLELLEANGLACEDKISLEPRQAKLVEEAYHHTYQEERQTMRYVREGRTDKVIEANEALSGSAGKLSSNELNAERNLNIACITLATRAAIEGGVRPATAYRLSDLYINKIDQCKNLAQLYRYRRDSLYDFTKLVADEKKKKKFSVPVDQCIDYIYKHYSEKIYVGKIAHTLGVSESHLSRCFKKETGGNIQQFIAQVKLKKAENLLKYSEASLQEISDYLAFCSQSHFGEIFRKHFGLTPKQYREKYKPKEFTSNIKHSSQG